jgi:hypothetical protein
MELWLSLFLHPHCTNDLQSLCLIIANVRILKLSHYFNKFGEPLRRWRIITVYVWADFGLLKVYCLSRMVHIVLVIKIRENIHLLMLLKRCFGNDAFGKGYTRD